MSKTTSVEYIIIIRIMPVLFSTAKTSITFTIVFYSRFGLVWSRKRNTHQSLLQFMQLFSIAETLSWVIVWELFSAITDAYCTLQRI